MQSRFHELSGSHRSEGQDGAHIEGVQDTLGSLNVDQPRLV